MAVGAVVAIVVATSGGGSGGSGSGDAGDGGGSAAPYPTAEATCTIEVNVAMDVTENQSGNVFAAIGSSSPIFSLSENQLDEFNLLVTKVGTDDAETQIVSYIQKGCEESGNPILTQGQVDGLEQIATGVDATNLNAVTLFAPGG